MAISSSPEWSLAFINSNNNRSIQNPIFSDTFKTFPFLSLFCLNSRVLIAKSSSCSSPVLEDAAESTNSQVIQVDLKLQDVQVSVLPGTGDLNGLICTLFEDPQTEELGYNYYKKAKEQTDFRPKKVILKHVIRYLLRTRNWGQLYSLCEDFKSFQLLPDGSTCYKLISSCTKARKFRLVNTLLDVFSTDERIGFLAFDSAMKGYNKLHMYSSTILLYERMKSDGIFLDSGCYFHIMEAYLKMGRYDNVIPLFEEYDGKNFGYTPFMSKIYWILCESLGKLGRPFEALEFFREMMEKEVPEDHSFYSSLISSFLIIREMKMVEELMEEAEGKKMLRDPALFLKLVLIYIEQGMMERTLEVIYMMNRCDIKVSDCIFCAIVNGFSKKRGLRLAVKVYEDLILKGCEPGQVTYASIQNIYCRLGLYSEAEKIFSEMEQRGFDKCVVAYSTMISTYGKTGRCRDAMKLVAIMKEKGCEPNVWIYNSLLDMHGKALNLRQMEKIWKEMKRRKVLPDRISYTSVIGAYSRAREFETCMKYYREFRLNGGRIDRAMAGIMVAVFSKMNQVDELVKLLHDMKIQGTKLDTRLYRSALNALRDAGLQLQAKWLHENFSAT
ncbi:hypothetical protein M9H77_09184 [Catharanthus roseus]|uniref:Uncharacterized protein n=1 Tax=Catharanthus roseus TaxID=4058 RepID=A0ACC0C034_CATRO|nr:hypothetical protein M9H77_09184 [Catharanthus roseus]